MGKPWEADQALQTSHAFRVRVRVQVTNPEIGQALAELGVDQPMVDTAGGGGFWSFSLAGAPAFVQTQADVDRMRIVGTIGNPEQREHARLADFMEANFHTALDVRYALSDGKLTAAFLHPLRSLTKEQFLDGLRQVSLALRTAGAENASSPLTYGRPARGTSHRFEDPAVSSAASESPTPYEPPPLVKHVLVPILAAVCGAAVGGHCSRLGQQMDPLIPL